MRRKWRVFDMLGLLALAATVQSLIMFRAALPALDSLRSVAAAESLLRDPCWTTLASEPEPPLFPCWLAAVHQTRCAIGAWRGTVTSEPAWASSVQLAAAIPLAAWPPIIYLLTLRAAHRRAALIAGLLASVLPSAAKLGGEGLSESLFLAIFTVSVVVLTFALSRDACPLGTEPVTSRGPTRSKTVSFLVGGVLLGCAMLVRVEAALFLVVCAAASCLSVPRAEFGRSAGKVAVIALGMSCVVIPWLIGCGTSVPGETFGRLLGTLPPREGWVYNTRSTVPTQFAAHAAWDGLSFDVRDPRASTRKRGAWQALVAVVDECLVATAYVLSPLAGWQLIRRRRSGRALRAWDGIVVGTLLVWPGVACAHAARAGYLSSRHLLPLSVVLLPLAGQGLATLDRLIHCRLRVYPGSPRLHLATTLIVCGMVGANVAPLHADRGGHRLAATWITEHVDATERVLDSWGWTALYSGRQTYRYDAARAAFTDPALRYVVVEARELSTGSRRARTLRELLSREAVAVTEYEVPGGQSRVLIFRWRPTSGENAPLTKTNAGSAMVRK